MKKKKFRAINVSNKNTKKLIEKLKENGIEVSQYRINYFSSEKELVTNDELFQKIKEIID